MALTVAPSSAQYFSGVYSRDEADVVAVADSGALYRSVSGGQQWIRGQLGDKALRDVIARDAGIVVVGDSGKIFRSMDLGGTWTVAVVEGTPSLRRVESLGGDVLMAVGGGGTVLVSGDWGATWSAQASGTTEQLNAVRFVDGQNGWIAGTNGFVARTTNGGGSWTPVGLGTTQALNGVDASGTAVWVVGDNATAFRSANGGDSFEQLNLHADAWPDVKVVWLQSASEVFIAGGGGFIRRSVDGGATWTFQRHGLQGQISDLYFRGLNGWAASSKQRVVLRTLDGGATWSFPAGVTTSRTWSLKQILQSGQIRGKTLCPSPVDKNTFYAALGNRVYRSRNAGDNWTQIATIAPRLLKAAGWPDFPPPRILIDRTNAFVVSAKDTNFWVAAVTVVPATGSDKRVIWTADAGQNWHEAVVRNFGEYGIPLEVDPDRPDTMYFGSDDAPLMRSLDRGQTWSDWSTTSFRSPCDIVVVPESDSSVILVGDGITNSGRGRYWRSAGGSPTFTFQREVEGSEIPGMACSRLRNEAAFGTNWDRGGVQRTSNSGLSWPGVSTVAAAWGVDIAKDDPDCVIFGTYGGSSGYLSLAGGDSASFTQIINLPGSNYSFYARDRATILAEQSLGIHKLNVTQALPLTAQSVAVTSPNGGEVWAPGSVHDITWSTGNVVMARIEYRARNGDAWQLLADVEATVGRYEWVVPFDATAQARIRVSDAWDVAPSDVSDGEFTIPLPLMAVSPPSVDFGTHTIGTSPVAEVTISNPGSAPLTVTSIATGTAAFHPGRSSLSVPAGASDTVGVWFTPAAAEAYQDQLTIGGDGYGTPTVLVPLAGTGTETVAHDASLDPAKARGPGSQPAAAARPVEGDRAESGRGVTAFALWQNRPNPFDEQTVIRYALPVHARVSLEVFNVKGERVATLVDEEQGPGEYSVSFGPGAGGHRGPVPSGIYFCRFRAGAYGATQRMVRMK